MTDRDWLTRKVQEYADREGIRLRGAEALYLAAFIEDLTETRIREAYRKHAGEDDWGVKSFYENGLLSALRGDYDEEPERASHEGES